VQNKALEPEQNEALRALARKIIDDQFKGKVSVAAAAKPNKISHSLLFEFLDGRRGAGMKLLNWLSARTGRGLDDLLGRPETRVEYDRDPTIPGAAIGHHRDWAAARDELISDYPGIDTAIVDGPLRAMTQSQMPERLTAAYLKPFYDAFVSASAFLRAEQRTKAALLAQQTETARLAMKAAEDEHAAEVARVREERRAKEKADRARRKQEADDAAREVGAKPPGAPLTLAEMPKAYRDAINAQKRGHRPPKKKGDGT
jgi:hypothetical protein